MAKYLITGGCGFIGSHLADFLIRSGHGVRILDDLSTGKKENAPQEAELLIGSITEPQTVAKALVGVEGLFHLAAVSSIQQSIDQWHAVHQVNSGGTILLYETLAKLPQKVPLIYASSSGIYGNTLEIPIKENVHPTPLSPYGIDKWAGEWHAKILWEVYKVPSLSFRFFNVYGPRQDPSSPYSGVISLFAKHLSRKEPLTIYGDGNQIRDFIYVEDIVRTLAHAMTKHFKGASIYNLCTGNGTTINQLADVMGEVFGHVPEKRYAPPRNGEIRTSIGDPNRVHKELGFQAYYSLAEGLRKLCV